MVCCKFGKDGSSGVCGSPAEFYLPDLTVGRFCQAGGGGASQSSSAQILQDTCSLFLDFSMLCNGSDSIYLTSY